MRSSFKGLVFMARNGGAEVPEFASRDFVSGVRACLAGRVRDLLGE